MKFSAVRVAMLGNNHCAAAFARLTNAPHQPDRHLPGSRLRPKRYCMTSALVRRFESGSVRLAGYLRSAPQLRASVLVNPVISPSRPKDLPRKRLSAPLTPADCDQLIGLFEVFSLLSQSVRLTDDDRIKQLAAFGKRKKPTDTEVAHSMWCAFFSERPTKIR